MTLTLSNREKRWGWLFLVLYLFVIPNGCALALLLLGAYSDAAANLLAFFLNALLAVVFFRELLAQSLRRVRWRRAALAALEGFAVYWLVNQAVMILIFTLKPDFANVNDAGVIAMLGEYPRLMTLAVVFAAPLAEECLFRGWIFTYLAERSLPLAYAATALFFSGAHIAVYVGQYDALTLLLCLAQYLAPSLVLCRTCRKGESLLAPLLLHCTINTIALFVTR